MPDLKPDTSFYPKAGSGRMSLGDLLTTVGKARQLQFDAQKSQLTGKYTRPDGSFDAEGYAAEAGERAKAGQMPGYGPADVQEASQTQQVAIATHAAQNQRAAELIEPLLDKGSKVTHRDLEPVRVRLAGVVGPQAADKILAPFSKIPDGAPLFNAITDLHNAYKTPVPVDQTLPGQYGEGERQVTASQKGRAAGQGGLPVGGEPPEFKEEREAATHFTDRTSPLLNGLAAARKLPENATGGLNDEFNELKKAAISLGVKGDWKNVQNYDELKKSLEAWANQSSSGGTNARLVQAIHSNPNMSMTNATIKDMIKVAYAGEAQRKAVYDLFISQPASAPSQFPAFQERMDQLLDRRAFLVPMMSKEAGRKMLSEMSPAEREKFERSYEVAKKYLKNAPPGGWFVPGE